MDSEAENCVVGFSVVYFEPNQFIKLNRKGLNENIKEVLQIEPKRPKLTPAVAKFIATDTEMRWRIKSIVFPFLLEFENICDFIQSQPLFSKPHIIFAVIVQDSHKIQENLME